MVMKKTASAPTSLEVVLGWATSEVWVSKAASCMDTVNSYVSIWDRLYVNRDTSSMMSIADTTLYLYPKSIIGYNLKLRSYETAKNYTTALVYLDSLEYTLENYCDPCMPDSSEFNYYQWLWWNSFIDILDHIEGMLLNPIPFLR